MLNICHECEIRESSIGFIHILASGIYYLKGEKSQLSGKIMIASLIKATSSDPEKCSGKQGWKTAFPLQMIGSYIFIVNCLCRNNAILNTVLHGSSH